MRAWLMNSYDGEDKLQLSDVPEPPIASAEVLLRMRFAALNPADAFLARALYPAKPPLPHVLGRDGVGDVVAAGPDVKNLRIGDTVGILRCDVGVATWGTLAEMTAVPANSVAPVPRGWSHEEMAGAPLAFLTAWQALTQWSEPPEPPKAGTVLLVTGASGGVGAASILLGKSMNLIVVALSRSPEKRAKLQQLGADLAFDPNDPNVRKMLMAAIAPKKVDLVVDTVGGVFFNELIGMLGHGGRISVVGRSGGPVPEFNTASLFFRRNRVGGVAVSDYTREAALSAWNQIVERLGAMGKKPVVDSVFPLEEVKQAFARLAQGPLGKVVIRVAR